MNLTFFGGESLCANGAHFQASLLENPGAIARE